MYLSHAKKPHQSQVRRSIHADVPLTPMIDVVFQLLIYFVLTFELPDRISNMQVWRPSGPGPSSALVVDRITVLPDGVFTFNDTEVSVEALRSTLHRYADLDPGRPMIVVATAASAHHSLVKVLDLANEAGLENISLLSAP